MGMARRSCCVKYKCPNNDKASRGRHRFVFHLLNGLDVYDMYWRLRHCGVFSRVAFSYLIDSTC